MVNAASTCTSLHMASRMAAKKYFALTSVNSKLRFRFKVSAGGYRGEFHAHLGSLISHSIFFKDMSMKKFLLIKACAASLALCGMGLAGATDQLKTQDRLHMEDKDVARDQDQLRDRDRDQIYLGTLMTPEERSAYMERLRLAKTEQERARIREQHRTEMDARAKERGISSPSEGQGSSDSSSSSSSGGTSGSGSTGNQGSNANSPGKGKQ